MDGYSGPGLQMPHEAQAHTSLAEADNAAGHDSETRSPPANA